jgi:hypothetical protein
MHPTMLVGLGLLHAVTALPRMDEQNILTAQAAQSRDCDAHLEKIGCVDGDWKNAHGHTCADLRKNKNGAPDWVDNDGKKAADYCCQFCVRDCFKASGCIDGFWLNAAGHTCGDMRTDFDGGTPDMVDQDGRKMIDQCCQYCPAYVDPPPPATSSPPSASPVSLSPQGVTAPVPAGMTPTPSPVPSAMPGTILCPGKIAAHYCDCHGDCGGHHGYCDCPEAQTATCCAAPNASPAPHVSDTKANIMCPGKLPEEYCDCDGDCSAPHGYCACAEAETESCCGAVVPSPVPTPSPVAV